MRTSTRAHEPVRSQRLSEKANVCRLIRREQHAGTIRRHAPADGDGAARMQSEDSMRAECYAGHRCGVTTRRELDQFQPPAGEQAKYLFDFTVAGFHGPQSTLARAVPLSKKRTTPRQTPCLRRRLAKEPAIVRGKLAEVPETDVHSDLRDRALRPRRLVLQGASDGIQPQRSDVGDGGQARDLPKSIFEGPDFQIRVVA